jgi:hypothetical protein
MSELIQKHGGYGIGKPAARGPGQNRMGNFLGARWTITGDDYDRRLVLRSPRNP